MNAEDIIRYISENDSIILISAVVSAVMGTLLVYRALLYRDPLADRIQSLNSRQRTLKTSLLAAKSRQRHEQSIGFMREWVKRLNLLRSKEAKKIGILLSRAGYRDKDATVMYFFAKLTLPFILGGLGVLFLYVVPLTSAPGTTKLIIALVLVAIGGFGPNIFVKNIIAKREKKLRKGVPDALDLLVICAEAGQSLDASLKRVAKEMGQFSPEISDELSLTSVELGLMPDRRQALDNLVERVNIPEIRNVVNALNQTEKYGTPLAHTLRVLSGEYRNDRMMKAEEKAARLPAIMTVPMIIFILPPLFVVLLGPAVTRIIDLFRNYGS
ncbi:MAG: type II secretion system F family protein [Rhodospirillaceae bacterium]|jgi:tight adherence protein C|nr:type II secretion system F family protein [Rhodospirillaceae bacterium]